MLKADIKKEPFDIYDFLKKRPMSYSMYSSFLYDPGQWYVTYILGERSTSPEMEFGSMIDKKIQTDPTFLPSLPRYEYMQYKVKVILKNKYKEIPLVGIPDGLNLTEEKVLSDYKTGRVSWQKARADETEQLTFYLLFLWIQLKHKPEEFRCFIHWLPTRKTTEGIIEFIDDIDANIQTFETKRTMSHLLESSKNICKTVTAMQDYVNARG